MGGLGAETKNDTWACIESHGIAMSGEIRQPNGCRSQHSHR